MLRVIVCSLALVIMAAPITAKADPIQFEWASTGDSSTLISGTGTWTVDSSVITPDFGNYIGDISAFEFNWETSLGSFSSSSAMGNLVARGFLTFSAGLELIGFDVCVSTDGDCAAKTGHPLIRITNNFWGATRGLNQSDFVFQAQSANAVPISVPEPGTLALFGLGIVALGLNRRRRRV